MKKLYALAFIFVFAAFLSACQKKEAQAPAAQKKLTVVTTLFPLYDFARAIAGDKADVTLLLPPGHRAAHLRAETGGCHDGEQGGHLRLHQRVHGAVGEELPQRPADTRHYDCRYQQGGYAAQGRLPKKKGRKGSMARHHHHHGGMDPHIWLDFANAQIMVDNILSAMVAKDPANRDYYTARAAAYKAELTKLDDEYRAGLANCGKRVFLHGGHYAFGYLAKRYGLQYLSASAVNADAEPTPAKLAELVKLMRANGLKYVYSEELLSPRSAETIAKETGATVLLLHGAHNISKDDLAKGVTFIALMKKNLENLRTGLECR